jgi:uncharacterized protein (TIGR03083 family)
MLDEIKDKADLIARIDPAWNELISTIESKTGEQLTGPTDDGGWTARDHIAHLAAWENSMVFLLQGKARHEGLGVSESTYFTGDEDEINDAIFQRVKSLSLADARARLTDVHQQMLALLDTLTDDDLQKPYSHYLPNEPGRDDGSPIINRVYGNTAHHFDLHGEYIDRIAG